MKCRIFVPLFMFIVLGSCAQSSGELTITPQEISNRDSCINDLMCHALDNPGLHSGEEVAQYVFGICDSDIFLRRFNKAMSAYPTSGKDTDLDKFAEKLAALSEAERQEAIQGQKNTLALAKEMKGSCKAGTFLKQRE